MRFYKYDIVFQEVPHHISLAFYICGCPLRCPGCHSPELWTEKTGYLLTEETFLRLLKQYRSRVSCILFMGGEWHIDELVRFLQIARGQNYMTALYTGLEQVSGRIESHLDFLKTGPWKQELGGLSSPKTNQVFRDLKNKKVLNHLFR